MIGKYIQDLKKKNFMIFICKVLHSYLTPKFLWKLVIRNYETFLISDNKPVLKIEWFFKSLFWFWPSLHTSVFWRDRTVGSTMGPQDYVIIPEHSKLLVEELLKIAKNKESSFLDLACNSGRFLKALYKAGYQNLSGMDISASALAYMAENTPEIYDPEKIKLKTMQEYLLQANTESFDIVYTHGATVELIPPTFPLVEEVCRISKKYVVFYISESGHHYPRFWEIEFNRFGFQLERLDRRNLPAYGMTLMVFRKNEYE